MNAILIGAFSVILSLLGIIIALGMWRGIQEEARFHWDETRRWL